jgi:hypothetical protein
MNDNSINQYKNFKNENEINSIFFLFLFINIFSKETQLKL